MDTIFGFINSQPFIALFLVIGIGYAVGRINIAGFSLGLGAVLFVGLAIGAMAPDAAPPPLLGLVGLVMFLYGIGIQYGKDFFKGLASSLGIKANILATIAIVVGCGVAIVTSKMMGFGMDFAAGVFAGSMVSTASLQAAIETVGNNNPAVSYALTYPFGVFGPMLCFYLAMKVFKPKIDQPTLKRLVIAEAQVGERGFDGKTVAELHQSVPKGVELLMIRRDGLNMLPEPTLELQADDIFQVAGFPDEIAELKLEESKQVRGDRRQLEYVRVFASSSALIGTKVKDLPQPEGFNARVVQIRRGDVDVIPGADIRIEYGDQVGVLVEPDAREKISDLFGDSVQAESEFDFIALGVGLVLGGLVGLIPFPVPGIGSVTLGVAGGALVVSLVLGYFGRLGPLNWNMPVVANVVLRNFGITVFLAGVGLSSGPAFAKNLGPAGMVYVLAGMIVLLTVVSIILIGGYYLLKLKFDDVLGIACGSTGNPAILAYANQLAPTGQPNIIYAMIFPGVGTIVKLIAVQVMLAMASTGVPPG
jgi:putative transport protein